MRAATIAEERAHAHSRRQCWHAVKEALLASGVISSRPTTAYAKQAGQELVSNYGFRKLAVNDPYQAPVGSVLVYNASRAAGHVEYPDERWVCQRFSPPKRHPTVRCSGFSLSRSRRRWQFHTRCPSASWRCLRPSQDAQCAPDCSERHCNPGNPDQSQAKPTHQRIRPRAGNIAKTIAKCIDQTFSFVFVLSPQDRERTSRAGRVAAKPAARRKTGTSQGR